jgi:hypothetical protein
MVDIPFQYLNNTFRIAHDEIQWVIQQNTGVKKDGTEVWVGRRYIRSTKEVLLRDIGSLKIIVSLEALDEIANLPGTFEEFKKPLSADLRPSSGRSLASKDSA